MKFELDRIALDLPSFSPRITYNGGWPTLSKGHYSKTIMKHLIIYTVSGALFAAIALAANQQSKTPVSTKSIGSTAPHQIFLPSDLQWTDAPPGLPSGAKMAVLDGDPTKKGSFTVRLQAPDGYRVSPHTHPTAERITVITGMFHVGMGDKFEESAGRELPPGGFVVLPAGMSHYAWVSGETVIQIQSEGPFQIKYVNPADDPRTRK